MPLPLQVMVYWAAVKVEESPAFVAVEGAWTGGAGLAPYRRDSDIKKLTLHCISHTSVKA